MTDTTPEAQTAGAHTRTTKPTMEPDPGDPTKVRQTAYCQWCATHRPDEDPRWPCETARLFALAAHPVPDSGLREALASLAVEFSGNASDYRKAGEAEAARAWDIAAEKIAALATPEPTLCDCEPQHVWPCATIGRCDEPGCEREATCGWPSRPGGTGPNGGYRRTCGPHKEQSR